MTALTFESFSASPRRSAVRRNLLVAPSVSSLVDRNKQPAAAVVASIKPVRGIRKEQKKTVLVGAVVLTLGAHVALIAALHRPMEITPLVRKAPAMAMEIAPPPPPPPPVIQPKLLPQVAAVKPVARQAPPSVPVVRQVTEDSAPSADTVQVATATAQAPAPVAAAPAPVAEPEPVTEPKGYAGYLNNPAPTYPAAAQKRGLQGRVVLKVHVLASGQPDNISVTKSSGFDILDEAAVKAVTAWVFDPAKRGQKSIDGWVNVPINFKIS